MLKVSVEEAELLLAMLATAVLVAFAGFILV